MGGTEGGLIVQKRSRCLLLVLCLCVALLVPGFALAQEGGQAEFTDTSGHWAAEAISDWAGKGLVGGYPDGSFQPNAGITRAEFMAIVNRAMGYQETVAIDFSDVEATDWFFAEVAKAVQAGYITGYQDGTMQPKNRITRQEVATIISRLIKLTGDVEAIQSFTDRQNIGAWCQEMVGAVVSGGYMGGYPDGTFQPENPITRAETVTVLQRMTGELYNLPGTYGPEEEVETINGNVTINTGDITLQNIVINGVLHLTAGIGDGDVLLKNVTVTGTAVISGGGENSIVLDRTELNNVVVERKDGKVRIVAQNGSNIKIVVMQSGGILEQPEAEVNAFGEVVVRVPASDIPVELVGGCDSIRVESAGVTLNIAAGTKVGNLEIAETAANSQINLEKGSAVTSLDVKAVANVSLEKGSTVTNLDVNAAANITGSGTIEKAQINESGAVIESKPKEVEVAPGNSAVVGGKEVSGDDEEKPSGGGGGGGGGDRIAPTITGASFTLSTSDEPYPVTIHDNSISGEIDLSKLDSSVRIISGSISVSEDATLTLTSPLDIFTGQPKVKELTEGENTMTVFEYLGGADGLDKEDDGVFLATLKSFFGDTIELKGTLVDNSNNSNDVTLTIKLP
jgi:hypothetical protein